MLYIISAPSGCGKTSLISALGLKTVVTYTTRSPRPTEMHGIDYNFLTVKEFKYLDETGFFAEASEVYGNWYGTSKTSLRLSWYQDIVIAVDLQGYLKLRESYPDCVGIYLLPPSFEILQARLSERGDTDMSRLQDISDTDHQHYDHVLVNDSFIKTLKELQRIVGITK